MICVINLYNKKHNYKYQELLYSACRKTEECLTVNQKFLLISSELCYKSVSDSVVCGENSGSEPPHSNIDQICSADDVCSNDDDACSDDDNDDDACSDDDNAYMQ